MKFLGTGSALPKKVVSNDDLAQVMDTSDEWIRSRTGIGMRHIAVEETTTSMAVEAAEKALADAKISGCEIDLIIAGTISPDYIFPSLACVVPSTLSEPQPVSPIAAIEALSITQTAFAFKFFITSSSCRAKCMLKKSFSFYTFEFPVLHRFL